MNKTSKSDVKNCSLRKKIEMILKNEVIDIQTSGYNGAHTEVRNI